MKKFFKILFFFGLVITVVVLTVAVLFCTIFFELFNVLNKYSVIFLEVVNTKAEKIYSENKL